MFTRKIALIVFCSLFLQFFVSAQNGNISHWVFGNGAGIEFDSDAKTATPFSVPAGTIGTVEGCSSISDANGVLQFYSDGMTVWGKDFKPMPGADYKADPDNALKGDPSSSTSAIIVPKPFSKTEYYIFTVDEPHQQNAAAYPNKFNGTYKPDNGTVPKDDNGFNDGVNYSLIDMSLNGGNGDIVPGEKNIHLETYDKNNNQHIRYKSSEKLAVIENEDCSGFWVVAHFIDTFYAFSVDANGVNKVPVKSRTGTPLPLRVYREGARGQMKASLLGDKIAIAHHTLAKGEIGSGDGLLAAYDFDKKTGIVSNENVVGKYATGFAIYGVEFSPNGSKIYCSAGNNARLYQFDLDDNNRRTALGGYPIVYSLQLGPDGKIYGAKGGQLATIEKPDLAGADCVFNLNGFQLSDNRSAYQGLPLITTSFYNQKVDIIKNGISDKELTICKGEKYILECLQIDGAVYEWKKDGTILQGETGFSLEITEAGVYEVKVQAKNGICIRVSGEAIVKIKPAPQVEDKTLSSCDVDGDGKVVFDLTTAGVYDTNDATLVAKYYPTKDDADNDTNEIADPTTFEAAQPVTEVFVKIEGDNKDECISFAKITLKITPQPNAGDNGDASLCNEDESIIKLFPLLGPNADTGGTWSPALKSGTDEFDPKQDAAGTYTYSISNPGCDPVKAEVVITIYDKLDIQTPSDMKVCDENPLDGFAEFQIDTKNEEITKGNADYVVTYHINEANAKTGDDPLTSPYTNTSKDKQTIYVRVVDSKTSCKAITTLNLIVLPVADATFTMKPSCTGATVTKKGTEGGVFSFDPAPTDGATIDPSSGEITNGTPEATYTVKYTITGDCEAESTLDITLLEAPKVTDPSPLQACDDDPIDGFTLFDLEARNGEISGGNTTYVISYHLTQAEADANTGALPLKGYRNATKDKQTVYVRVVGQADDCVSYTTLELIVIKDPDASFTVTPNCYSAQATATVGGGVYTLEPAPTDGATINPNTGLLTGGKLGQTYTIKYSITQGCEADSSQTVTLLDGLDYKEPQELKVCDEAPLDGFAEFDLKSKDAEIVNGNATYSVTYHKTQADAEAGINPLISPYTNEDKDTQIVYAHVTDSQTDCEAVTPLTLVVTEVADAGFTVESTCDGAIVVTTVIGGGIFTLDPDPGLPVTIDPNTGTVTGGTFPATYTIRYSITGTCEASETREVTVLESPEAIIPKDLIQCDEEGDVDGIATFDLTLAIPEITNNNPDLSVQFFETKQQAEDGIDPITNPKSYKNSTPTKQTLFVKVTSRLECSAFTTLTIRVLPNPSPGIPITLEECDDDNDGVAIFDLTINEPYIINNETDVILSYYRSLTDAQLKQNEINNPKQYPNESNPQTIYVRIDNMGDSEEAQLGCYAITSFEIKVNKIPDFNVTIEDFVVCDDDGDGQYAFDLETKTAEILNNTDSKSKYKVTYHETQAEADSGDNALASLYINKPPSPQTIYVRIEDKITRCANTKHSFLLIVNSRPDINSDKEPLVLEECDDNVELDKNPANDSTVFDIASITPEVLDGLDPATHIVSYYTSQENADSGTNPITNLSQFTNTTNPQIIYIRVDNTDNTTKDCYATTTLTLIVNPLPYVNLDDYYLICQETNGTEVTGEVEIDTELSKKDYSFEWTIQGSTEILSKDSSYAPTQGGIYTVKVVNKLTLCEAFDTTTVTVSTPPILSAAVLGLEFTINQSIKVIASSTGLSSKYEFSLNDGPWLKNSPNNNTYIFKNVVPGPHTIKVRDINGCGVSETTVFVLGYPPFFTPNNDGYNDTWQIYGIENFPGTKIHIFDRFGKLLKQISPMGDGWDGSLNGRPLPSTDYWFSVQYIDKKTNTPKQFKAHFALKR